MDSGQSQIELVQTAFWCGVDDWAGIMGDPLISGTVSMLGYGVTGWLILRVAAACMGRERWLWGMCGAFFLFQVANTHLDLHALIWTVGRCLAHAQGWYQDRREVQAIVIAAIALTGGMILLITVIVFWRNILGNLLLVLGTAIALMFTVIKGVSLHGLAAYYDGQHGPFRTADLIEYSGIVLALLAALIRLWRLRPPRRSIVARGP
ncbi:MAG: hypothetical protein AAGB15_00080 [Pseudomonadota bacterium]